jgi:uncharacterized protein YndB with AHSA1/START domain
LSLHLERVLAAPVADVFELNTEPELLAQWWGPNGFSVPTIEMDARVGGRYRITMQPPVGDAFVLSGEYRAVDGPSRLEYTFRWDPPDPDDRETVVSLSFRGTGGATQLTIDQGEFATEARRVLHVQGWSESIDRLEVLLSRRGSTEPG